jgi:hypothetical protein
MGQGHASLMQTFNAIIVHTQQAQRRVVAMGINPSQKYLKFSDQAIWLNLSVG